MKNERAKSDITRALYETEGMIFNFNAKVLSCEVISPDNREGASYRVVLDQTAFFPEGGGQQSDTGFIGDVRVVDVETDEEGVICHYVTGELSIGCSYECRIDEAERLSRMQNHSAEHIVSGIINKTFGYENVGFHMGDDFVRFDIDGVLTADDILRLENEANRVVYRNIPITISFPTDEEAKEITYRSKIENLTDVRLVTIGDVDTCACCAPHVYSTGQIGLIKIIDYMPHRGGTRITMVAGLDALKDYNLLHNSNKEIMALLSSKREDTAEFTRDLCDKNASLREEIAVLKKNISKLISKDVLSQIAEKAPDDKSPVIVFSDVLDNKGMRDLINTCVKEFKGIVAGFIGENGAYNYIIGSSSSDVRDITKALNDRFTGRGGGSLSMTQGSINANEDEIRDFIDNLIKNE